MLNFYNDKIKTCVHKEEKILPLKIKLLTKNNDVDTSKARILHARRERVVFTSFGVSVSPISSVPRLGKYLDTRGESRPLNWNARPSISYTKYIPRRLTDSHLVSLRGGGENKGTRVGGGGEKSIRAMHPPL